MKYLLIFLIIGLYSLFAEDLYDPGKVRTIEIEFYDSNYKQLLEENRDAMIDLPARITLDGETILDSIGVRYKGNSSYNIQGNKKSFNISIDAFRDDQRLMGYKTLNLNNGFVDPTFMRERIVHQIYSRYMPALKTGYTYLYINGEEYGLYSNVEQINKDFLGEWYDYKSGNLYKGDPRGELSWKGSDPALYQSDYEKKTNEDLNDWTDLVELINVINNSSDPEQELPKVLNTDRALWYFALSNIFVNLDSYIFSSHNYYIYEDPSSHVFDFLPWDLNESFGTFPPSLPIKKVEFPTIDTKAPNRNPLLKKMMSINTYKQIYYAHYRTILNEYFNTDSIMSFINIAKPLIEEFVRKDPMKLYSYDDFNNNITTDINASGRTIYGITDFVEKRRAYLLKQADFQKAVPEIKDVKCISDILSPGMDALFNVLMESTDSKKVRLHYRAGQGVFQSVEMFDDGNHSDGIAGDNVFGVSVGIPSDSKAGWIDFYGTAINNADVIKFFPERAENIFLRKSITQQPASNDVVINEFMASNVTVIQDENGGYADWIELYNKGAQSISLKGWFITDDINKTTKWQFPEINIEAKGYLILWADEDQEQGELHTNFKLSKDGEYIGLYDADTNLVDSYIFGKQTEDVSEGRYPNGTGEFIFMVYPTPKAENLNTVGVINSNKNNEILSISPNPASEYIMLNAGSPAKHESNNLIIFNNIGEIANKIEDAIKLPIRIDISNLDDGIYFLKFNDLLMKFIVIK